MAKMMTEKKAMRQYEKALREYLVSNGRMFSLHLTLVGVNHMRFPDKAYLENVALVMRLLGRVEAMEVLMGLTKSEAKAILSKVRGDSTEK